MLKVSSIRQETTPDTGNAKLNQLNATEMPNGVRSRGNSRQANRRRNAQRDNAVRAEMVAPEIVIQAEPIFGPG